MDQFDLIYLTVRRQLEKKSKGSWTPIYICPKATSHPPKLPLIPGECIYRKSWEAVRPLYMCPKTASHPWWTNLQKKFFFSSPINHWMTVDSSNAFESSKNQNRSWVCQIYFYIIRFHWIGMLKFSNSFRVEHFGLAKPNLCVFCLQLFPFH